MSMSKDIFVLSYWLRWYFHLLLIVRFSSEFIDLYFETYLSQVVSSQFVIISFLTFISSGKIQVNSKLRSIVIFFILFLTSGVISFLVNKVDIAIAGQQLYKYVMYMAVMHIGYTLYYRDNYKLLFLIIVLASMPSVFYSLFQAISNIGFTKYSDFDQARVFGFSAHPVLFGIQITLVLVFTYLFYRNSRDRWLFSSAAVILLCAALYYSFARTAWVMIFFGVFFILIKLRKKIYVLLLLLLMPMTILVPSVAERFADLSTIPGYIGSDELRSSSPSQFDSSMHWRIYNWYHLLDEINYKIYFGYGPGMAEHLSSFDRSLHSSVVDVLFEQGLLGVLLLFAIFLSIFFSGNINNSNYSLDLTVINSSLLMVLLALIFSVSLLNQTLNMILVSLLIGIRQKYLYMSNLKEEYIEK